jgi:nucleotide-binding universal stress UspA family protein
VRPERSILVPVHDSASSRSALRRARSMARSSGARLRVLSVQPLRALATLDLALGDVSARRPWRGLPGLRAEPHEEWIAVTGEPCTMILSEADRADVGLVVVGHGERTWWTRPAPLPLHRRLIRRCSKPVVVVRTGAVWEEGEPDIRPGRPILQVLPGGGSGHREQDRHGMAPRLRPRLRLLSGGICDAGAAGPDQPSA